MVLIKLIESGGSLSVHWNVGDWPLLLIIEGMDHHIISLHSKKLNCVIWENIPIKVPTKNMKHGWCNTPKKNFSDISWTRIDWLYSN